MSAPASPSSSRRSRWPRSVAVGAASTPPTLRHGRLPRHPAAPTELWDAAFDGPRWRSTSCAERASPARWCSGSAAGREPRSLRAPRAVRGAGPRSATALTGLVLAGTKLAFAYGSAGNTCAGTPSSSARRRPGEPMVLDHLARDRPEPRVRPALAVVCRSGIGPGLLRARRKYVPVPPHFSHAVADHIATVFAVNDRRIVARRSDDGSLESSTWPRSTPTSSRTSRSSTRPLDARQRSRPPGQRLVTVADARILRLRRPDRERPGRVPGARPVGEVSLYGGTSRAGSTRSVRRSACCASRRPHRRMGATAEALVLHGLHLSARGLDYLDGDGAGVASREIGWPALRARLR